MSSSGTNSSRDQGRLNYVFVEEIGVLELPADMAVLYIHHVGYCLACRNGGLALQNSWIAIH